MLLADHQDLESRGEAGTERGAMRTRDVPGSPGTGRGALAARIHNAIGMAEEFDRVHAHQLRRGDLLGLPQWPGGSARSCRRVS
jgi:hypothetical protein